MKRRKKTNIKKGKKFRWLHESPDRTHDFLKTSQKNSCASKADGQEFDSELQLAAGKSRRKMFIFMATSRGEVAVRGK